MAQLYVSDPVCSVMRPVKELKGFKKVFLKPGESRRITLDIPVSSLAFYSEAQSQFVVEPRRVHPPTRSLRLRYQAEDQRGGEITTQL